MIALTYTEYLQKSKNQSPAFQAPLLVFHPILSLPPILPSSSGNSQAGLARALILYCHKHSGAFYICYWETLRLVLVFPQPCSPPECWGLGGRVMAPFYSSTLNAGSKCLWVRHPTSLPARVNAWRAEMLFIFGRLAWLRSLKKDTLKAFWAISFVWN